jgi:hypothetical protein
MRLLLIINRTNNFIKQDLIFIKMSSFIMGIEGGLTKFGLFIFVFFFFLIWMVYVNVHFPKHMKTKRITKFYNHQSEEKDIITNMKMYSKLRITTKSINDTTKLTKNVVGHFESTIKSFTMIE